LILYPRDAAEILPLGYFGPGRMGILRPVEPCVNEFGSMS
jgi:hypothetical protein